MVKTPIGAIVIVIIVGIVTVTAIVIATVIVIVIAMTIGDTGAMIVTAVMAVMTHTAQPLTRAIKMDFTLVQMMRNADRATTHKDLTSIEMDMVVTAATETMVATVAMNMNELTVRDSCAATTTASDVMAGTTVGATTVTTDAGRFPGNANLTDAMKAVSLTQTAAPLF